MLRIVKFFGNNIEFSDKSEKESLRLSTFRCRQNLDSKTKDDNLLFEMYDSDVLVGQGVISSDLLFTYFTTSEEHSIKYIRSAKKLLNEHMLTIPYLSTFTISWYKESISFLKFLGFYRSNVIGDLERWVLDGR